MNIKKLVTLALLLFSTYAFSKNENPIIESIKADRTNSLLVVSGVAKALPPGTKLWVSVVKIDNQKLAYSDIIFDNEVVIKPDNTFVANLRLHGHLDKYNFPDKHGFPDGRYQLEFSSHFNPNWQSKEILTATGVEMDSQGRTGRDANPKNLPESKDFISENGGRYLEAVRTVAIGDLTSKNFKKISLKKKILEGVSIGMSAEAARASSWGKPRMVNRTITANGKHEQWVYGGNNYLYFTDGFLT